jgi:Zn finger protein HypA/HybF involved in hydrogenase expression
MPDKEQDGHRRTASFDELEKDESTVQCKGCDWEGTLSELGPTPETLADNSTVIDARGMKSCPGCGGEDFEVIG